MLSRTLTLLISGGALLGAGAVLEPAMRPLWQELRAGQPALRLEDVESGLGQGMTLGLLGGFRALVADLLWLEVNHQWEQFDLPATQTLIRTTTAIDPGPLVFWINGARMIAYDMPVWRMDALAAARTPTREDEQRINREQARAALALLDRALAFHPHEPLLYIEQANIHYRRLRDIETAARLYRLAAGEPHAPFYAARLYAVCLEQLGRPAEAYAWLRKVHSTLPADNPFALRDDVLRRIRRLEEQLGITGAGRYAPDGDTGGR